jgi:hypothetical protein
MANRDYKLFRSLDRACVTLYLQAAIGATGAPTLSVANSVGIKSIVRNGVGDYTVTFGDSSTGGLTDNYNNLRDFRGFLVDATGRDFTFQVFTDGATSGTIRFICLTAAVTTELPNGTTLKLAFTLKNSSVV